MQKEEIEMIISSSIQIGVINTLSELGLIKENISEQEAFKKYGRKQVIQWRERNWIKAYPTGNKERSKVYFKRSELETASRMLDLQNTIPATLIKANLNYNV